MRASYREYVKINKNLIVSIVLAVLASAATAQLLAGQESYINSSYTLAVDYAVFYSSFSILFYIDNKRRYRLQNGTLDRPRLKSDLVKIVTSMGAGELAYLASRWYLQYYLLTLDYEPYLASIIAHMASTLLYLIVVNLSVKFTRLYRHGT